MNMNNTQAENEKKQKRKEYMKAYMRKYNETRKPRRVIMTETQRQENLKK